MAPVTTDPAAAPASAQRRTLVVLSIGQVLSGVGLGAGVSLGALLVASVSGDEALSGLAATAGTLGAAVFAIPLARLAGRSGRRPALSTGALLAVLGAAGVIGAAALGSPFLLLGALLLLGAGNAANLQARFAATDLASSRHRGRDLSIVVWTTTVGIVAGPNLVEPGQAIGRWLSLPDLTGAFVITAACQLAAVVLYLAALRPDPLREARRLLGQEGMARPQRRSLADGFRAAGTRGRSAIAIIALGYASMVSVMAMTPVHLTHQGATLSIVGLTISLHTLGMFGFSPVFGWLSDRIGRESVVLVGQAITALSLIAGWLASQSQIAVTVALVLLGLGWSATTIAGSALVAGAVSVDDRPAVQGLSDTAMNLAGALGGALAGVVLALIGYSGLNGVVLVLVAAGAVLALRGTDRLAPGADRFEATDNRVDRR
jgi:MFS family permease